METMALVNETVRDKLFEIIPPSRVQASLRLKFEREGTTGRTVLARSQQDPPLKVVRAFTLEDGAAFVHLHNVSGGLLGGDELSLSVRVGPGASVQLTTTGATRIYRPRKDAMATVQRNEITVGENALLEYVPDAIIPFAGARFSQRTSIELASGAGLFWWEIFAPGREARGEVFEYELLETKTDIVAGGRAVAAERIRLEPRKHFVSSLIRMGPCRYWSTFYVCRVGLGSNDWLAAEQRLREVAVKLTRPGETLWGASTLVGHGLVVRCLARHGRDVLPGLHAMWRAAKMLLYDREATPPRKVN
jgi:urease accessory protein